MAVRLVDIYYVAGLIDGEGSFSFNGTPIIQLTLTDLDLLQNCRLIMKRNAFISTFESDISQQKDKYKFSICGSLAIEWMMTLYPLLCRRRKERIKEIISLWSKCYQRNSTLCKKGHLLNGNNLILEINNKGGILRRCRFCKIEAQKRYRINRLRNVS